MDPRFNRAHGAMAGLIFGRSLGVDTSTKGRQAFADAVWNDHLLVEQTRQEFQASALVAAAISLGIDKKNYRASGIVSFLQEVINYVAALPPHGSASSGPDVLQATRKAIGIVLHFGDDIYERLRESIGTSADPTQSVPAAFALVDKSESRFTATNAAILGGETSLIAAISSAVQGAICGITMFSPDDLTTIERVSHPGIAPLADRLVERRVYVSDDATSN